MSTDPIKEIQEFLKRYDPLESSLKLNDSPFKEETKIVFKIKGNEIVVYSAWMCLHDIRRGEEFKKHMADVKDSFEKSVKSIREQLGPMVEEKAIWDDSVCEKNPMAHGGRWKYTGFCVTELTGNYP